MNTVRMFPILNDPIIRALPWSLLASHERQARDNHSQSLSALASRGGLSIDEAYCVIKDQRYPFGAKWNLDEVRVRLMRLAAVAAKQDKEAAVASVEAQPATPQLSGDACRHCGNFALVRTGTCQTCQACGETSGCS